MPLIYLTSTAAPGFTHEPLEIRALGLDGGEALYTLAVGSQNRVFVPQEHVANLITALAAIDPNITLHTAAE